MRRWMVLTLLLVFAFAVVARFWWNRARHQIVVVEGSVPVGGIVDKVNLTDLDRDGRSEAIVFASAPYPGSPMPAFLIEMQNGRFVVTKLPETTEPRFESFVPKTQMRCVEAYLTPQGEVVAVTKSESGNLIVQTIAQNAAFVVAGDWDKDCIAEEVLVAVGSDKKELRLFKRQPDGIMKQIAFGKLTPQDPPTVGASEGGWLIQGSVPGRLQARPLDIRGDKIFVLHRQDSSRPLLRADLDNDGEPDEVRLRSVKGKQSIVVQGRKIFAEIPLAGFSPMIEVKAAPLAKNDRRKALFCLLTKGSRWRLQVWKFESGQRERKLADVSGDWGFTPIKPMPRFVDLEGDNRTDLIVEAYQKSQPKQTQQIWARLILRQTEKGWEARVEREKGNLFYGVNPPFLIVGDSPVWLIRSIPRQVKVATLTYIRPHMKTVWDTEVFVMGKEGKWQRRGKLAGRGVALAPFGERIEFADTNDDGVPELVTLRPDLLGFDRTFFWWFTPKKGWQGVDLGPTGWQQFAYAARENRLINITAVLPVNWDGRLWLTIFWSDGTIKAVRAPKVKQ